MNTIMDKKIPRGPIISKTIILHISNEDYEAYQKSAENENLPISNF